MLGKPPIAFVQDLRLERAVHLLRVTQDSVDEIAGAVGYERRLDAAHVAAPQAPHRRSRAAPEPIRALSRGDPRAVQTGLASIHAALVR